MERKAAAAAAIPLSVAIFHSLFFVFLAYLRQEQTSNKWIEWVATSVHGLTNTVGLRCIANKQISYLVYLDPKFYPPHEFHQTVDDWVTNHRPVLVRHRNVN